MSEEKPVFKVKDRRLFNSDGTPRDVIREEEPAPTPPASETATANSPASQSTTGAGAPVSPEPSRAASPGASPSASASPGDVLTPPASGGRSARRAEAEADPIADPSAFVNLLMFIASPAAAALGISEHPGIPSREIDLPLAKHCIDLLGTLRQKTDGNLNPQEEQIFEGLLAELRMQFVALSTPRPGGGGSPRGFTGSDITGGR